MKQTLPATRSALRPQLPDKKPLTRAEALAARTLCARVIRDRDQDTALRLVAIQLDNHLDGSVIIGDATGAGLRELIKAIRKARRAC